MYGALFQVIVKIEKKYNTSLDTGNYFSIYLHHKIMDINECVQIKLGNFHCLITDNKNLSFLCFNHMMSIINRGY